MFVYLIVPFVLLLSIGPLSRWKNQPVSALYRQIVIALGISFTAALLIFFSYSQQAYMAVLGLTLSFWILIASVMEVTQRLSAMDSSTSLFTRLRLLTRSHWGMILGHVGFAVTLIGITLVSNYEQERDVRMLPGEQLTIGDYTFAFKGIEKRQGPNYEADAGQFIVYENGQMLTQLEPEKRIYTVQRMPMTEAAIHSTLTRDLFIALGEPLDDGAWAVRVYIKPFVVWIWGGGAIMALGGICAMSDKRYRMSALARFRKKPANAEVMEEHA